MFIPHASSRLMQTKPDNQLRREVLAEIAWDPTIDSETVDVEVENGTVTVTGTIGTLAMRAAVLEAARRVTGPRVVDAQTVAILPTMWRNDGDIAHAIRSVLGWHSVLGELEIDVNVTDGWATLSGLIDWHYQAEQVERAIRDVRGLRGITTHLQIRRHATQSDVQRRIELALRRNFELNAEQILVDAHDGTVTLRGRVRSWIERQCAERAAWSAPGVNNVLDELIIA